MATRLQLSMLALTLLASGAGAEDLPAYYQKKATWRMSLDASLAAIDGPSQKTQNPLQDAKLWEQLAQDFPLSQGLIHAAKDWFDQEKLSLAMPPQRYKTAVTALLEQTQKVLQSVSAAGGDAALKAEFKSLADLCAKGGDWRKLFLDLHLLRRRILLSHPALNFPRILLNVNPPTLYSHNCDQHLGRHSRVGPGLMLLSDWKSENPRITPLLAGKLPAGAVRNPDLNYDADKVVFSFCDHTEKNPDQRRYFLYEAAIDGSWVKQLTGTARDRFETCHQRATVLIEDTDPCYLPDGSIAFISTRSQSFGRCHGGRYTPAWVLYKCDANGDQIQQLSYGNENEYEPAVLNDGRLIFSRWEYTNRHEMLFHKLWTCRPDGTNVTHFYGNDSLEPMMVTEPTAIAGTGRIVATAMGHHSYSTGTVVVLDTDKGENGEAPVTHITPETPYAESHGWPLIHFSHPYPITEELFLVSRANHKLPPQWVTPPANDRGIYLIDAMGSRELLFEDPAIASVSPIALRPRKRPPVLLPSVAEEGHGGPAAEETATLYVQNAYLTRNDPEQKIRPGAIKAIRVNALGVQPRAHRAALSSGVPVEIPKRILGTVPVSPDGSVSIKVPARTCLQMQILDENGMAILTERSFFYLQPGETRGCIGCHEAPGSSPQPVSAAAILHPRLLEPPAGPQYKGGLSFMRTVQPVLDRYCLNCHGLESTAKGVSLIHDGKISWPASYREIVSRGQHDLGLRSTMWGERNFSRPYQYYAQSNKVARMILEHHGQVQMDPVSRMRFFEFLDLNAQCYGDLFPNKLEERRIDPKALGELRAQIKKVLGEKLAAQPERALINTAEPAESRILNAPLTLEAGGWGQLPVWKTKEDPGYRQMEKLVNACILHDPNENTNGWEPTLEQGGGEDWILKSQKEYVQHLSGK